jgi:predicted Holliday junction resolvase-like endonuclease
LQQIPALLLPVLGYLVMLVAGVLMGYVVAGKVASVKLNALNLSWEEKLGEGIRRGTEERETQLRREGAMRSGRTLSGGVLEKFSPLMDQFPFDPHDAVWLGRPVDFLVFDGLSDDRESGSTLRNIAFVEVKSGRGQLSARQRRVKEAVEGGRVSWKEVRIES